MGDALARAIGNAGDDHSAVAPADEDDAAEIL